MPSNRQPSIGEGVSYLDSHVHFWKLERGDYHWLKAGNPIHRDFMPSELLSIAATESVTGFIAVQAAPTVAETEFLLELASRETRILGVVGYLNPCLAEFRQDYRRLRKNPRFVGIRLDRAVFEPVEEQAQDRLLGHLRELEEDGFPVDLLIRPENTPAVLGCLKEVPKLKAVINHLGGPPIREGVTEPWAAYIDELSAFPNVFCKWSGMITPANGMHIERLEPYIRHTAERFGPDRIMFGSDWPVALLAGTYEEVVRLFEQLLPESWNDMERARVRSRNAAAFYFGDRNGEG